MGTTPVRSTGELNVRPMSAVDLRAVEEIFRTADDDALHPRFFTLGDRVVMMHLADLAPPTRPRCLVEQS